MLILGTIILVFFGIQLVCCAGGIWRGINRRKCITGTILLFAILADISTAFAGQYMGGRISQMVICIYFIEFIGFALYMVPREIGASARAKELEYELQNSRVSTIISQIQHIGKIPGP